MYNIELNLYNSIIILNSIYMYMLEYLILKCVYCLTNMAVGGAGWKSADQVEALLNALLDLLVERFKYQECAN